MDSFDKLLELAPYDCDLDARDEALLAALNGAYEHHFKYCKPYRRFCVRRGLNAKTRFQRITDIPALPVQAFKEYGGYLTSLEEGAKIRTRLESSATSGRPSVVQIDKITSKRQIICMAKALEAVLGGKRQPFIIVDADPRQHALGTLGARAAAVSGFLNLASEAHYVLDADESGNLWLNRDKLRSALKAVTEKGDSFTIFGFTYVLFEQILGTESHALLEPFNANAKVLHIGGWKKLEDRKISKALFNKAAGQVFNLNPHNVIDVYGFTEQMGIVYPSFADEEKTTSSYCDVIIRDPVTNDVLPDGEPGLLEFVTPLPYSYPGIAVTTDDLGVITGRNRDPKKGLCGTKFKVLGRAKNAEVRGCGDIMSEYVRQSPGATSLQLDAKQAQPVLLFSGEYSLPAENLLAPIDSNFLPNVDDLSELINSLRANHSRILQYSSDELIAFLSHASRQWLEPDSPLKGLQQQGLSFLANWLNSANLRAMADESLRGRRGYLDGFRTTPDDRRLLRATPRGLVVHWLAGNVPLLGMLGLAQAIVTKNINLLKAPSSFSGVLPAILKTMADTNLTMENGRVIRGDDIAATIAVIYYPREDVPSAETISKAADLRVAWGGREAIEAVMSLPKSVHTEDIIFGPKLSYMAIGREMLEDERAIRKITRKAATDASVFDQYACASPHTIFVETGENSLSPKEFAQKLAEQMDKALTRIPKEDPDAGTVGNINSARMLYEFTGDLWTSEGSAWTVLYDEKAENGLATPTYSRVILVRAIDDIMKAADFADPNIQTIGLGLDQARKIEFAERAALNGAMRFPDIGRMTHFDTPWDGLYTMSRMVKWVSLGGPLV